MICSILLHINLYLLMVQYKQIINHAIYTILHNIGCALFMWYSTKLTKYLALQLYEVEWEEEIELLVINHLFSFMYNNAYKYVTIPPNHPQISKGINCSGEWFCPNN